MLLLPPYMLVWSLITFLPDISATSHPHIEQGHNVFGAILFFSYIVAALYFTSYILLSISRIEARSQAPSKSNHGKNGHSSLRQPHEVGQSLRREAFGVFLTLALASFTILSWNMLNFLIVSYLGWASAHGVTMTFSLESLDRTWHDLHRMWTWATASNLFQTFAEDLVARPAEWKTIRVALIYSYTWNSWMSALGRAANIQDLWAYFVLDQILPVSFTQNLFCTALTKTTNVSQRIHGVKQDGYSILSLRLAGFLCYLIALYRIPSTIKTAQFLPTLFTLRVLLFTPYLVDCFASYLRESINPGSTLSAENFNKFLVAMSIVAFAHTNYSEFRKYTDVGTEPSSTNYAVAALSHDMVIGSLGSVAFFLLLWRRRI